MEPRDGTRSWVGAGKRGDSEKGSSYTYCQRRKALIPTIAFCLTGVLYIRNLASPKCEWGLSLAERKPQPNRREAAAWQLAIACWLRTPVLYHMVSGHQISS